MKAVLFCLAIVVFLSCEKKDIKERLTETLNKEKGNYALAFKDLQTGEEILINEHRLFHAASTMKTPVMIEVFKQLSLSDSVAIKTTFNSIVDSTFTLSPEDDSEKSLYTIKKTTIDDLVKKMIINSSNLATNILIEIVGAKNVTQSMRDLGAKDILVLRGVEDGKAYRAGLNNKVTAYDLMLIFSSIVDKKEMIDILLQQQFNDIIPAKLPKEVKVAHKTGWITGLHHDSGIVILPDGRKYVLVILSDSLEDEKAAIDNMATVSKMIYDYVDRE
ncbi:MAG: serine hydrolase [Bacteroidota bacterium]